MKTLFVWLFPISLIFTSSIYTFAQSLIYIGNTQVKVDTLITGLDVPWETTYYGGSIWASERKGIVSRIDTATGTKKVLIRLTGTVVQQSESGLLGMALHPDFNNNPEVFLAYTYLNSGFIRERIVKYRYENDTLLNPVVLLNNLPGNGTHNGCRLYFLSDTTLLASTGDVQNLSLPQDTTALSGKILRMRTDGTPPPDNPFPGNLVYSLGHRNVQGIAILPCGKVVLSEHGASTDDEIQILHSGRNYGWPNVEGYCSTPTEVNFCNSRQIVEPLQAYTPTIAPSDLVFYENPAFPEWDNTMLLTILKNKQVRALRLNETCDSVKSDLPYLTNRFGRLRDITVGANKEIYLATNGASWANTDPNTHSIIRLRPITQTTEVSKTRNRNASVKIWPNPAEGHFQVAIGGAEESESVLEVINQQGRLLFRTSFRGISGEIKTSGFATAGLCLVRIIDSNGIVFHQQKIVLD